MTRTRPFTQEEMTVIDDFISLVDKTGMESGVVDEVTVMQLTVMLQAMQASVQMTLMSSTISNVFPDLPDLSDDT